MHLPQIEFTHDEHSAWEAARQRQYDQLNEHGQVEHIDFLKEQHRLLTQAAFIASSSGVRTIHISSTEDLRLCHARASSTDGIAVLLAHQTTRPAAFGNGFDLISRTIATFGEKISIDTDIHTRGSAGIGVSGGQKTFPGIVTVHRSPMARRSYIPYRSATLSVLENILASFDS